MKKSDGMLTNMFSGLLLTHSKVSLNSWPSGPTNGKKEFPISINEPQKCTKMTVFGSFSSGIKAWSLTKTKIFGQFQFFNFLCRSQELLLVVVIVRELDNIFLVFAHQPGR